MSDTVKKVQLMADASSVQQEMEKISQSGNELYDRLKTDAQAYSDSLEKQSIYIEKNLKLEKQRLQQQLEYSRNAIDLRKAEELNNALPHERKGIESKYKDQKDFIDRDALSSKQEILDAQRKAVLDFNNEQRNKPTTEESAIDINKQVQGSTMPGAMMQAGRLGMTMSKTIAVGLGLGISFGIAGILSSMIENTIKLDKASKDLNVTMGGFNDTMFDGSWQIGRTKQEMIEFTKEVAVTSGGKFGERTAEVAKRSAEFAKGYGVDESVLTGSMAVQRMTKTDMNLETMNLLREMLSSGTIKKGDFTQLGEKIDFWSRLNDMQSKQMLTVSPFRSAALLGAVEQTKLPVLSDQRQIELLQGINEAIRSPNNEYKNAFVMNALNTGDLVGTLIRKEQGVFGEGNVRDVLNELKSMYGSKNQDQMILGVKEFLGISYQTSQLLVQKLFNDEKAYNQFIDAIDKSNKFSQAYEREKDPNKKEAILEKWKNADKGMKDIFGNEIKDSKLAAASAVSDAEKYQKIILEVSGNAGRELFNKIKGAVDPKDFEKFSKTIADMLSLGASTVFEKGAQMIKEAAPLFKAGGDAINLALKYLGPWIDIITVIPRTTIKVANSLGVTDYLFGNNVVDDKGREAQGFVKDKVLDLKDALAKSSLGNKYGVGLIEGFDPTGKGHEENSLHYKNLAFDLQLYNNEGKKITKENYPDDIKKFFKSFAESEGIKYAPNWKGEPDVNHFEASSESEEYKKVMKENTAAIREHTEILKGNTGEVKKTNEQKVQRVAWKEGYSF